MLASHGAQQEPHWCTSTFVQMWVFKVPAMMVTVSGPLTACPRRCHCRAHHPRLVLVTRRNALAAVLSHFHMRLHSSMNLWCSTQAVLLVHQTVLQRWVATANAQSNLLRRQKGALPHMLLCYLHCTIVALACATTPVRPATSTVDWAWCGIVTESDDLCCPVLNRALRAVVGSRTCDVVELREEAGTTPAAAIADSSCCVWDPPTNARHWRAGCCVVANGGAEVGHQNATGQHSNNASVVGTWCSWSARQSGEKTAAVAPLSLGAGTASNGCS